MMEEIWKDVDGFEGLYRVSNMGRMMSSKRTGEWADIKLTNKKGWYLSIVLTGNGMKTKSVNVHALVANAFGENNGMLRCIHHIDLDKQNNRASNLMWISSKDHAKLHSNISPDRNDGMKRYNQEIRPESIVQLTIDGSFVARYRNAKDAGDKSGVCARNILQVASKTEYREGRVRKQAGGFAWIFEKDYKAKMGEA